MSYPTINKCQYDDMSVERRTQHAWIFGNLLCSHDGQQISCYLYQVADFFVEMIFDRDKKKILNVYTLSNEQTLEKYLKTISLDNLLTE